MSKDEGESQTYDAQINGLWRKAYATEGEEKLALLEEGARLADSHNDADQGMQFRDAIVDTATWAGFYEKALIAFNWMLARHDRDPEQSGREHHLLWIYKWIAEHLHQFPQISRQQIEQSFADMQRRFEKGGHNLRAVHKLRCIAALEMGDGADAERYERLWQTSEEDALDDCKACDVSSHVGYFIDLGRHPDALKHAKPLLAGRLHCSEVPNLTYSRLLLPLLRAGQVEPAVVCQRKSYRQMRESRKFLSNIAEHLVFYTLTGQTTKAVKLLEARLPWAAETRKLHDRFNFYLAGRLLLRRLGDGGRERIKLRLPESLPPFRPENQYSTAELADWFLSAAKEIAEKFDGRNGNDRYARLVEQNEALAQIPEVPLPPAPEKGEQGADSRRSARE